ncbi:uncharacterized protein BT62DRAFT_917952 [Guyanagaster necrorhizus]|uniref:F-box domain-containing protein n=1 Tax=Guyanagaster necrorhizus TaxID=856835 RepID=A0A9P7VYP9_9AGAR|nr:uncharacterized protein BT62DRAFT_917952 [Guyanagaster necrorhizus MCA 3950]KAG7449394.1 hypothetical protein BT62DRAFT_917952 [Guyanagaster necrorhizus MCA 3950]
MQNFLNNLQARTKTADFQRLLQSNERPTEAQIVNIRKTMLAEAMQRLSELHQVWETLQQIIDDCKTVVSPMRQLPPEILLEIFHWTIADQEYVDVFCIKSVPWTLGQVCRTWHEVVQSDPRLWSNLLVRGFSYDRNPPQEPLSMLKTALRLSKDRSLSIRCSFDCDNLLEMEKERNAIQEKWPNLYNPEEDNIITLNHRVLQLLVDNSRRWKNARFRVDDYAYLSMFNAAKGKLDRLETLNFGMIPGWIDDELIPTFDAFAVAPKLFNIELSRMGRVKPVLPYEQLFSARMEWCDRNVLEEHLVTLHEMPNLQEYDLDGFDYEMRELSEPGFIHHNALRVLHVCTPGALTNLVLPNLEEVHLKAASLDEICRFATLDKLPGLIERSGCSIRKLTLADVLESSDIIPVLERTPNLNELHVELNHWHYETDEFMAVVARYLRIRKDGREMPVALPRLHTLTMSVRGSPKWDIPFDLPISFLKKRMAEMIRDRWNIIDGSGVNRLKSVRIYVSVPSRYHIAPYDEFIAGIEELQKQGLDISIVIKAGHETLYGL